MSRPALEVADIFRDHGAAWRTANAGHVSLDQLKVMSAIERCRTAALGGHVARCEKCSNTIIAYNSCRNRHCPKCQGAAAKEWLAKREAELLPVPYFHVVFTLPGPIADIAYQNKAVINHLLRHHRTRREHETGALDRVDLARRVIDLGAERMGERVVERERRPGRHMDLLVLGVHRVFGERLQMFPAAQRAEATNRQGVYREVAPVTLAEYGALCVRRLELASLRNGLAVGSDDPLGDVEAAPGALRQAHDDGDLVTARGVALAGAPSQIQNG